MTSLPSTFSATLTSNSKSSTHPHLRCTAARWREVALVALPVKVLKAGQESYWLDQIARNREEYFSGHGESPGRFMGNAAAAAGLEDEASPEQVRAMFQGLDPATGEQRCAPLWRADPRTKLAAGPLLVALKTRATEQGVEGLEDLAGSKALKGDVRSVQAACRLGGAKRVKVETVERLCRKVLGTDPRSLCGEAFDQAWQHRGKRASGQAGGYAGPGVRPLLLLPQERVAAGRRRQPTGPAAAGRGTRRGSPSGHSLFGAARRRRPP
jgi:hypothetical protein